MKKYNVAIVGAAGAVGHELMKVLAERQFPINELRLLDVPEVKGKLIKFGDKEIPVDETANDKFDGIDIALFACGGAITKYVDAAIAAGAICIDNSSTYRYDPEVPLVVPEVNPEDVMWNKGLIANPNCSTIQMVVALKPLHDYANIKKIVVSTYQAVSGAGKLGLDELEKQVKASVNNEEMEVKTFQHQIAFNLIPHIDVFQDNGYTKEEMKMHWETRKMFHSDDITVSATAVRVPVYRSHSEAITIFTEKKLTAEKARELLANAPDVVLMDKPMENCYPMPIISSDTDQVYVGRIREDIAFDNALDLFVVADQIRKGAATNAVQIAQLLVEKGLV